MSNSYEKVIQHIKEMLDIILFITIWLIIIGIFAYIQDNYTLCFAYLLLCIMVLYIAYINKKSEKPKTL